MIVKCWLVAPLHQCHEKVKLGAHDTMSLTTDDSSAQVEKFCDGLRTIFDGFEA